MKTNIPPISLSAVSQYSDLIVLEAYQMESEVVFFLKIALTDPGTYTLYKISPTPIPDKRTGLHNMLLTLQKYITKDDDSYLFIPL